MGYFLRFGLSSRLSILLHDCSRVDSLKNIHQVLRLLSTGKTGCKEDTPSESTLDKNFEADLMKFKNEYKVSLPRSTFKSEDFVPGPDNNADIFGTLHKKNPYLLNLDEGSEEDCVEDKFTSELPNYLPQKEYVVKIKKLLNQRRFADALDVLQVTMLKEHRVKPEYYIYSILIAYCGRTGYSKMASKLFNDMKKRGLPVYQSVYTSLFNSFANSPFPLDGLKRTRHLFSLMNEKGIEPNQVNCHATIKAFGRCGSIEEAFKVVDYMMSKRMELKPETMSFLFHACISDKEAGFRHALLVYQKMMQYQIKPDAIHFNLLLHCVRECCIGDIESTVDVLKRLGVKNVNKLTAVKVNVPPLDAGYAWEEDQGLSALVVAGSTNKPELEEELVESSETSIFPNLFSRQPSLGCVVSLSEMATAQDRLFLLGGIEGFLNEMLKHNAKPDIKTLSILLECSPESCAAEESFLQYISKFGMQTDLLFFNTLIRRRVKRQQYSEAKEVLSMIAAHGFQPDLMTYTNLAMACRTITEAYEILKAMDESGLRPGIEFITAMLGCATSSYQMKYIYLILDIIEYEEMEVNSIFIKKLDYFYEKCLKVLQVQPQKFGPTKLDAINNFCQKYYKLKANFKIEQDKHPWEHLREKHPQTSKTDEDFFGQHVEPNVPKHKFSRLGPTAAPKVREAKLKKLKEEDFSKFKGNKKANKPIVKKLEGIDSVVFQKLALKEP